MLIVEALIHISLHTWEHLWAWVFSERTYCRDWACPVRFHHPYIWERIV